LSNKVLIIGHPITLYYPTLVVHAICINICVVACIVGLFDNISIVGLI